MPSTKPESDLMRGEEIASEVVSSSDTEAAQLIPSGLSTAKKALEMLVEQHGFVNPDQNGQAARKNIARAFAGAGKVVYGKAFDALKVTDGAEIDFQELESVEANLASIVLYEVKSTNRESLPASFDGYFFSLSTAELLVAQSLADQFKFILFNTATEALLERTLRELLGQTKNIYPGWSISLGAAAP